jgi:predicted metal-binding protein
VKEQLKKIVIVPKDDLIFDYKVKEQCKACKRYGVKATCPPNLYDIEYYKSLLPSYKHGMLFYKKFHIDKRKNWRIQGRKSSLDLHKYILGKRKQLISKGHCFIAAFGAGSCKLCKECSSPCRLPGKALIPLEAAGLNLVEMMRKRGVAIKFPVSKYFFRIGGVFYD